MPALEIAGVTARWGQEVALHDLDLTVTAGELVVVLGGNGAGKSTLVSVAAGLHAAYAGTARVAGFDVRHDAVAARRRTGVVGQHVALYPTETLRDNLRLFGSLAGLRGRELTRRVEEVARAVGVDDALPRRADRCSAGQRRRAHVAAAFLHRPEVLLLDEPAAHLDLAGRQALVELVRASVAGGTAVCWCTNDPAEAAAVVASTGAPDGAGAADGAGEAGTVAVLARGRLLLRGTPSELARRSAPPTVEVRFDGPPPLLPAFLGLEVSGHVVRLPVTDPSSALTEALLVLGDHVRSVRSIRVVEPDLSAVLANATSGTVPRPVEPPPPVPAGAVR